MLFSWDWLKSLCGVEAGPSEVASALTGRGLTVDAVHARGADSVLDVDVPANRPDCLGHLGLARELSAAFGVELLDDAEPAPQGRTSEVASLVEVKVDEPELCRRYTARVVREVRVGPSPTWVVERLEACGLRSINNVVDASNLVMLETGNPIHFFDLERVADGQVHVRRARRGESLVTLDGIARELAVESLVIADARKPIALAGVMGGADSEIGPSTRDVLVEAAWFLPLAVRAESRRLGLKTDASHRFERGVDPEGVVRAQALAARLLSRLAGGAPVPGLLDAHPGPLEPRFLSLRLAQVERLLGYRPRAEEVAAALRALRMDPQAGDAERIRVRVPSWRMDLEREVDLVEEVARHLGYDRIPSTTGGLPALSVSAHGDSIDTRLRLLLAGRGFHEAFGYAMIAAGEDAPFVESPTAPLCLTNPIAEGLACLRRTILPGLLRAVDLNLRRGVRDVRLFETGHVFQARAAGEFPLESRHAALAWTGAASPRHWSEPDRGVDLFDVTGVVEYVVHGLRPGTNLRRRPLDLPAFQPGLSVRWDSDDGEAVAWAGALHPRLAQEREIGARVFLAEIDTGYLERRPASNPGYRPPPRQTEVARDLSIVLPSGATYQGVLDALTSVAAPTPVRFEALDRYEGPPLDSGQFSLTVRVRLEPRDRTLTDNEIETYRLALIDALRTSLGVAIRG